jgi:hypothetical protein
MAATCSICRHSSRAAIEEAHVQGASLRAIAKQFAGVSAWAVRRHFRNCLPGIIQKVTAHQDQQNRATAKLPGRVEVLIAELERFTANALRRKDYSSALRAIAGRLQCLKTLGELSGELRPGGLGEFIPGTGVTTAVQVNLNTPAAPAEDEEEARARLMQRIAQIYNIAWPRKSRVPDDTVH